MVRAIPADPQFATESEREVWSRLLEQAGDDWTLVSGLRLTDESKDHELDVIVLIPGEGVVVVEVKGGVVSIEGDRWSTTGGGHKRWIHPVDQARHGKHALRRYVDTDPRWR